MVVLVWVLEEQLEEMYLRKCLGQKLEGPGRRWESQSPAGLSPVEGSAKPVSRVLEMGLPSFPDTPTHWEQPVEVGPEQALAMDFKGTASDRWSGGDLTGRTYPWPTVKMQSGVSSRANGMGCDFSLSQRRVLYPIHSN